MKVEAQRDVESERPTSRIKHSLIWAKFNIFVIPPDPIKSACAATNP